ncbi:APC family permease [Homoserinibacter sp. YIM 151385]|uniref:APC family permease n=1 Tax=Homoserinibacter sp. YIM 151385 TaxID=2985506 RepID=UPI0022F1307F|nr:APC family permease [Homoserinibacter sp. YIM 151385]WBU38569.1 APC family permease [Homoserinibacter sp. YIM 151385]
MSDASAGKGLATGQLGLLGSTIMGLASTAPVYSLVATLGFTITAVGAQSPIAFVLAFIPMFFIAFAYRELNRAIPDCGTTFTWATKAFGPWAGWMGGWGVAVAGIIVLANLAQIAGIYLWILLAPLIGADLSGELWVTTATGVGFIAAMVAVSYRGVEIGERLQNVLLGIQYLALALFVVLALSSALGAEPPADSLPPQLSWFDPFAFESFDGFTEAVLLALFIYWGWDTCLALNEETKDPKTIPGRAALLSTLILMVTYVLVTVAAISYAGLAALDGQDDVFLVVKDALFGPWAWLLVLAVLISAVSSTQTTILPTARGTLSMAVYGALPRRFGQVHPRFRTPGFSTLTMGLVAILFYVGMTFVSENFLADSIYSLGLAIAFYYGITGYACVWYFRRELFASASNVIFKLVFPLLGALLLTAAFVKSAIDMLNPDYGATVLFGVGGVFVIGIGSLLVGVVLMVAWSLVAASRPFFRGESLNRETPVLVPDEEVAYGRSVDGGRV